VRWKEATWRTGVKTRNSPVAFSRIPGHFASRVWPIRDPGQGVQFRDCPSQSGTVGNPISTPFETCGYCPADIIVVLTLLLKCPPTTLKKYTNDCSQHSRTNKFKLDNCDLTKTNAASHTTNGIMFSSWGSPWSCCLTRCSSKYFLVQKTWQHLWLKHWTLFMWQLLISMILQIVITAKNYIIAISFFEKKTRTVIWNDTWRGTRLRGGKITSRYTILFTLHHNLHGTMPGMPYSYVIHELWPWVV
jgi:hypothetical protein